MNTIQQDIEFAQQKVVNALNVYFETQDPYWRQAAAQWLDLLDDLEQFQKQQEAA